MPDTRDFELIAGRLVAVQFGSVRSALVSSAIAVALGQYVREHRLGVVAGARAGLHLSSNPDTVRVCDLSFVRAERLPGGRVPDGFFPGAPDLAVESLCDTDAIPTVLRKVQQFLDAGTRLFWLVDARDRAALVFHPNGRWTHVPEDGVLAGEDVVAGFRLSLAEVWV
jgi:Uma2 family endonuclease